MPVLSDQQLIGQLQKLIQELSTLRQAMHASRPGCACTGQTLCALHAAVYNQIGEAIRQLAYAIETLGREIQARR